MTINMNHMKYLELVANSDVSTLRRKESTYKGSWKKRGGVGAFMMLARKWDRLESIAENNTYDIFKALFESKDPGADGQVLAEIRDLRCYLLLVEAEYLAHFGARNDVLAKQVPGTPEDGGHHELGADDAEFGMKDHAI